MEHSVKQLIVKYLTEVGPSWGGTIEDYVRSHVGSKGGTTGRRCRELVEEGKLDVCYKQVNGVGPHCVRYRIHI